LIFQLNNTNHIRHVLFCFLNKFKIDEEEAPILSAIVVNHFENIVKLKEAKVTGSTTTSTTTILNSRATSSNNRSKSLRYKRPSLVPMARRNTIIRDLILNSNDPVTTDSAESEDTAEADNAFTAEAMATLRQQQQERNQALKRGYSLSARKVSVLQTLGVSRERLNSVKKSTEFIKLIVPFEETAIKLCPKVDGRIRCCPRPHAT
jgi:hypothetical protein